MEITIGAVEAVIGVATVLIAGPVVQVITLRIGFNGLRGDVKDTKKAVGELTSKVGEIKTWIAVREDRERSV